MNLLTSATIDTPTDDVKLNREHDSRIYRDNQAQLTAPQSLTSREIGSAKNDSGSVPKSILAENNGTDISTIGVTAEQPMQH